MGSVSWDQYLPKATGTQSSTPLNDATPVDVAVDAGQPGHPTAAVFFAPRRSVTSAPGLVAPAFPTAEVGMNETPAAQYDVMVDLMDTDMFKMYSDMMMSDSLRIQQFKSAKIGYSPMMVVVTLDAMITESLSVSCLVSSWLCLTYT
jgi:hypothetical protein